MPVTEEDKCRFDKICNDIIVTEKERNRMVSLFFAQIQPLPYLQAQ